MDNLSDTDPIGVSPNFKGLPRRHFGCDILIPTPQKSDYIEMGYLAIALLVGGPINLVALTKLNEQRTNNGMSRLLLLKFHLNFTDLMVIFIYTAARICWLMTYQWRGGPVLCPLIQYLQQVAFYISSFVVVCIALDRLGTVFLARFHHGSDGARNVRIMLLIAWTLAVAAAVPQLFVWKSYTPVKDVRFIQCTTVWHIQLANQICNMDIVPLSYWDKELYNLTHLVLSFWLPASISIMCYAIILGWVFRSIGRRRSYYIPTEASDFRLRTESCVANGLIAEGVLPRSRTQSNEIKKLAQCGRTATEEEEPKKFSYVSMSACERININERTRLTGRSLFTGRESDPLAALVKAKRKIFRSTLSIVAVYIISWLPYNVLSLLATIDGNRYAAVEENWYFLYGLVVFNSVCNPFIYGGVLSLKTCFDQGNEYKAADQAEYAHHEKDGISHN